MKHGENLNLTWTREKNWSEEEVFFAKWEAFNGKSPPHVEKNSRIKKTKITTTAMGLSSPNRLITRCEWREKCPHRAESKGSKTAKKKQATKFSITTTTIIQTQNQSISKAHLV